ncbi:MAG: nucleotide sugar dehydrogenase [Magnetococcales bacterium]|nr:nucleotide sugar dehydrogenase [Magnetococcales bacterium]
MKDNLLVKLQQNKAVIGIIGLGYVGLPLALRYLEEGFVVVGFDIDPKKITKLASGDAYIEHIDPEPFSTAIKNNTFIATTDFTKIKTVDAIILCVPTPLNKNREPDLSFVTGSLNNITPNMRPGQVISLESTTYPGTTKEVMLPLIEASGYTVGIDTFVIYSPEREDPANPDFTTKTIPKVVGGTTPNCMEIGQALYEKIIDVVVPVSSTGAAEMVKILENTFRSVNIALVNELKIVADRMGLDIFEVIRAASTKPFGYTPFYPGPGLGGHCIPIDPFYLTWKAREYGINTRFIELAGEVNTAMPDFVLGKIVTALNNISRSVRGSRILVLGLAYKKNVDDVRESPSFVLLERLQELGAQVDYSDPHVPVTPVMRAHSITLKSVELTPQVINSYDCILVATDHDRFDWDMIKQNAKLLIDPRGVFQADDTKIYRA